MQLLVAVAVLLSQVVRLRGDAIRTVQQLQTHMPVILALFNVRTG
jgi:hypothetical protein